MKYWVYIDGFNLYNGSLRATRYKWLNLYEFCQKLRPNDDIEKVKFFTARVNARVNDPDQPKRQIAYWRALRTLPQIEIIEGHFLTKRTWMPEAASVDQLSLQAQQGISVLGVKPNMVEVVKSEEKGTDVNLAVHLVHDAHRGCFDSALIVSNDSDLKEAIQIVKEELGKDVGVCTPCHTRDSAELQRTASYFFRLPTRALRESQFPTRMTDSRGDFYKPQGW